MTTQTTPTTRQLERETCPRCGGTGHYSYCQMHGTTCFKCAGKKVVLTKRGAVAMAYLREIRSKRADQLQIGDRIWRDGLCVPGAINEKSGWTAVVAISEENPFGAYSVKDGVKIPAYVDCLKIETDRCLHGGVKRDQMFRVFISKEEEARTLALALNYQDTLTKTGTPRKAR